MTYADRQRSGTAICQKLAERVSRIAPAGLGRWEATWRIVGPPSATFMAALVAWEATGSTVAEDQLRSAYVSLVHAWERAAARFGERTA